MIVAIEGGDQTGKRTQSEMMLGALRRQGRRATLMSFPDYSTPAGARIKALLESGTPPNLHELHRLQAENRREKLDEIRAAASDSILIMDRYIYSNLAYGLANCLPRNLLEELDREIPKADLVIVLDLDPQEAASRKSSGRDRFEKDVRLVREVRRRYLELAEELHWKVVEAKGSREAVHRRVMDYLSAKLPPVGAAWRETEVSAQDR